MLDLATHRSPWVSEWRVPGCGDWVAGRGVPGLGISKARESNHQGLDKE